MTNSEVSGSGPATTHDPKCPPKWTQLMSLVHCSVLACVRTRLRLCSVEKRKRKKAELELNGAVIFARRGHCPPADDCNRMDIDSVPYSGYICLSQGLNGEPRKVTFGIGSLAPKTAPGLLLS